MIVHSEEEIDMVGDLFQAQVYPKHHLSDEDYDRILAEAEADTMTLEKYLSLPPEEKSKWMIGSNPHLPAIMWEKHDKKTGQRLIKTPFYFTPAEPLDPYRCD
ncbi:MAG: hypothetical protein RR719_07810 [Akkermansia sp.]